MSDKEDRNRRFYDFVMDQTRRQSWVSKKFESEWLQKATFNLGIEPFQARAVILGATASCNGFVETEIERVIDEFVSLFSNHKGRIAKGPFRQLTAVVKGIGRGALDERSAEQIVKEAMIRRGVKPDGRGLLRSKRWFHNAGRAEAKVS
ncbi:MAG: hypothetical protein QG599_3542 [Pseudomonadota bacterium]|nr:hypothetical protein [Pseudomonadota bacterium]